MPGGDGEIRGVLMNRSLRESFSIMSHSATSATLLCFWESLKICYIIHIPQVYYIPIMVPLILLQISD